MARTPTEEELQKSKDRYNKEILDRFCHNKCFGHYIAHHEYPHKYVKCCICGHTKELKKPAE